MSEHPSAVVAYVADLLKCICEKGWLKTEFSGFFFKKTFNFNRIKSATKFRRVKTSSG